MRRAAFALMAAGALLACLTAGAARAGQGCEEEPLPADAVSRAMELALRTRQELEGSGAQLALIARAGQDLSKYGLRYSHMGIVWRDHPQGQWLVVHELNQCGTDKSGLFNEGLGNFFLDNMHRYEASIIIPGPEMQARLAQLLASRTPVRLHQAKYNMLSYAYSVRYQNSNQWVLESYAAASAGAGKVETREEAQAWLRNAGFQPITVNIPAATRLGARMFRANVAFDDHPTDRRMAGQIDTVTVDSIARFVKQVDGNAREITVR